MTYSADLGPEDTYRSSLRIQVLLPRFWGVLKQFPGTISSGPTCLGKWEASKTSQCSYTNPSQKRLGPVRNPTALLSSATEHGEYRAGLFKSQLSLHVLRPSRHHYMESVMRFRGDLTSRTESQSVPTKAASK